MTFQDERSGLNLSTITDAANYTITKRNGTTPLLVNSFLVSGDGPTSPVTVAVNINNNSRLPGGQYTLTIHTASPQDPSGVQDVAGNGLQGTFYGFFPSGNGFPANFVANLDAVHHLVFPPSTTVGAGSPLHPPGTPATGFRIPTDNQGTVVPSTPTGPATIGTLSNGSTSAFDVHDAALSTLSIKKKK